MAPHLQMHLQLNQMPLLVHTLPVPVAHLKILQRNTAHLLTEVRILTILLPKIIHHLNKAVILHNKATHLRHLIHPHKILLKLPIQISNNRHRNLIMAQEVEHKVPLSMVLLVITLIVQLYHHQLQEGRRHREAQVQRRRNRHLHNNNLLINRRIHRIRHHNLRDRKIQDIHRLRIKDILQDQGDHLQVDMGKQ